MEDKTALGLFSGCKILPFQFPNITKISKIQHQNIILSWQAN